MRVIRSSPVSIVARVSPGSQVVPSGKVKVTPAICSSGSAWPSQVMRVSTPPSTSDDPLTLGFAVHLAVSSAYAFVGATATCAAPANTSANETSSAQNAVRTVFAFKFCMCMYD